MAGRAQDSHLDRDTARATQPELLAVDERRDRLRQLEALAGSHEVRHAEPARKRRPAAHVIGVDVGVENADDARPPLGHEALVPRSVAARVHDHRFASGDDHVGQARLAAAVDLPQLVAGGLGRRERHPHRLEVQAVGDHAALDVLRGNSRLAEHVHDQLGGSALGAQHHQLAVTGHLRDRAVRVLDEVEVGHVDGLHRPPRLDLPALVLVLVAHVEQQDLVAAVEPRQQLPHLHAGHGGNAVRVFDFVHHDLRPGAGGGTPSPEGFR